MPRRRIGVLPQDQDADVGQRQGERAQDVLAGGKVGEARRDLLAQELPHRRDLPLHRRPDHGAGQFVTDVLERLAIARLDFTQQQNVVAEVRLDRAADLACLHREQGILEWLGHHALVDPAQVATAVL